MSARLSTSHLYLTGQPFGAIELDFAEESAPLVTSIYLQYRLRFTSRLKKYYRYSIINSRLPSTLFLLFLMSCVVIHRLCQGEVFATSSSAWRAQPITGYWPRATLSVIYPFLCCHILQFISACMDLTSLAATIISYLAHPPDAYIISSSGILATCKNRPVKSTNLQTPNDSFVKYATSMRIKYAKFNFSHTVADCSLCNFFVPPEVYLLLL